MARQGRRQPLVILHFRLFSVHSSISARAYFRFYRVRADYFNTPTMRTLKFGTPTQQGERTITKLGQSQNQLSQQVGRANYSSRLFVLRQGRCKLPAEKKKGPDKLCADVQSSPTNGSSVPTSPTMQMQCMNPPHHLWCINKTFWHPSVQSQHQQIALLNAQQLRFKMFMSLSYFPKTENPHTACWI